MNIAIDIRCLMEKELTGVGEYTLNLLTELFKQDNQNEYYLFFNSQRDIQENLPRFKQKNIHYCGFRWPNKFLNLCLKIFKYPKIDGLIEKSTHAKIDFFFFPNLSFMAINCPYIITAHDLSFEFFPEFLSFKRWLWHKTMNPRKIYQQAKKIFCVSYNTKNDLYSYYHLPAEKLETIYSGIAEKYRIVNPNDPQLKEVTRKYQLQSDFILFLGTIEPRKNISTLIEAYLSLKTNRQLVLVGKLGWKYKKILRNVLKKTNINFIEYIPDNEKLYFYNLARVFVYPSFYEGFGFPPLEALMCGCPVITSNNSSLVELCGNKAILIDPNNSEDLATALKTALNTPKVALVHKQSEQEIKNNYNWEQTARVVLENFNQGTIIK